MSRAEHILLEVCLSAVEDARVALRCGADRVELNSALELGGLTPPAEVLDAVKEAVDLPVIAMIRPRAADFCYDDAEFETMLRNMDVLREHGADGFAFGVLTSEGLIDRPRCAALIARAAGLDTVFHRAFDFTSDPAAALEQLVELGVRRVLTSGQQPSAEQGAECIAALQRQAAGRIEILPGADIGPDNVRFILETTGCRQVHGSFSKRKMDVDWKSGSRIQLEHTGAVEEHASTDASIVAATRARLDAKA